ncbi:hypothetical protein E2P81_ATG04490 [Venturia nashicola]|nr:hypothetical protein E2P81_ATG04490 [Venturia nashicola]
MSEATSSSSQKRKPRTTFLSLPREIRHQILFESCGFFACRNQLEPVVKELTSLSSYDADLTLWYISKLFDTCKESIETTTDLRFRLLDLDIIYYDLIEDVERDGATGIGLVYARMDSTFNNSALHELVLHELGLHELALRELELPEMAPHELVLHVSVLHNSSGLATPEPGLEMIKATELGWAARNLAISISGQELRKITTIPMTPRHNFNSHYTILTTQTKNLSPIRWLCVGSGRKG